MTVRYRLADLGDADELAALHIRSWRSAYRGLMPDEDLDSLDVAARADVFRGDLDETTRRERGVTWVVAEDDGGLIGHSLSSFIDGVAVLQILYLDPDVFGAGVGQTLHDIAVRGVRRLGATSMTLKVLDGNDRAIGFYAKNGWELTGQSTTGDWSGIEVSEVEMQRKLNVDLLTANREYWNTKAADYAAMQSWSSDIDWGIFGISNEAAGDIFPDVAGLDVVELGCGTGYVSNWALQRGASSAIGLDNSPAQLATARQRSNDRKVTLPLVLGDAHRLPFADDSFDVAINEYGAAIWCDPRIWIPEAARVLRPGGLIWFLGNSVQAMLCVPEFEEQFAEPRMVRPQRGMHRTEWIDADNVEFHVSHGEMISILTGAGFAIEALHELYAEPGAGNNYGMMTAEWASQWPVEDVWVARLPA